MAGINATKSQYHSGPGPIPDSAAKKIMADQDIGMWNFYGALYGPPPVMDTLWTVIHDSFAQVPGAKFYFPEDRKAENDVLEAPCADHARRTAANRIQLRELGRRRRAHRLFAGVADQG